MNLISQLKCAFTTKQSAEDYYANLTKEELEKRKASQLKIYLSTSVTWVTAMIATVIAAKMNIPVLILYVGVIIALLLTTFIDYRKRVQLIERIIKSK